MTTQAQLDDRYGRTRRPGARRAWWISVGVVAAAAVAGLGWLTVQNSLYSVSADDLGFTVEDPKTVAVSFQVTTDPEQPVTCVLEALDEEFGVVGFRVIDYPASPEHAQRFTERVRTVGEATTGLVKGCWKS